MDFFIECFDPQIVIFTSQKSPDFFFEKFKLLHANHPSHFFSFFEDKEGWNGHDSEFLGEFVAFINIDFCEMNFALKFLGKFFYNRGLNNAGHAPFCKEIYYCQIFLFKGYEFLF